MEEMAVNDPDITIVGGLGRVGLPLGISFANAGLRVCLYDTDAERAQLVSKGKMPFVEHGAEALLNTALESGNLMVSSDVRTVSLCKYLIVTIGTPLDEQLDPDTTTFLEACRSLQPYLNKRQIIIIRSTVHPGALRLLADLLSDVEGGVHLAYCPERIVQGHSIRELKELPQVVSGLSETAVNESEKLFLQLSPSVIRVSVEEAELVKLFSNAWRYIEFAVSNQFYMMAQEFGADYEKVRHAMTEGYRRIASLPSPGFAAGPCLLKDTIQLKAFNHDSFPLGQSAIMVNEGLPDFLVDDLQQRFDFDQVCIGILGMTFKADTDDVRGSLSYKLLDILRVRNARVLCSDEFVEEEGFVSKEELIAKCDIVIVGAAHSAYRGISIRANVEVVDPWGVIGQAG